MMKSGTTEQLLKMSPYPAYALHVPAVSRNYDYVFSLCGELLNINVFSIGVRHATCGMRYLACRKPRTAKREP